MSSFFDGAVNTGAEELSLCLEKVDAPEGYADSDSIKGRASCLVRTGTHAVGIVAKPLYYAGFWGLSQASMAMLPALDTDSDSFREYSKEHEAEAKVLRALIEHEELQERQGAMLGSVPSAALAASLSQTVQLTRSLGGVIHPGLYYKTDPFVAIFRQLAAVAREVGCSIELVAAFEEGTDLIHAKLFHLPNRDYYLALFHRDLELIATKMKDPGILPSRKLSLLAMLDPLGSESGLRGCAPAVGRILELIVAHVDLPGDPAAAILSLADQAKHGFLTQMVMQADSGVGGWVEVVNASAHDPAHRGNSLVMTLGADIGMSPATVKRAEKDLLATHVRPLSASDKDLLTQRFFELYTEDSLVESLLFQVNSKPDGCAGLQELRAAIFKRLCEAFDAEALDAVELYYARRGVGDPSDPSFTDLNARALRDFAAVTKWEVCGSPFELLKRAVRGHRDENP